MSKQDNTHQDFHVVVYSKPNCQPCKRTKATLERQGISYGEIDLSQNPEVLAELQAEGFASAPIVKVSTGETWAGYNPDKLAQLSA